MIKQLLLTVMLASMVIFLAQCSNDDNSNPTGSNDNPNQFTGITETDDLGYILGGDSSDWCYDPSKNGQGIPPTEYALYPAFPNSSYYYFTLIYDLPAASEVVINIVDTSQAIIRELVNQSQEAGQYVTGWDVRDTLGAMVSPGIYRVTMTAGDFECHGDVEVTAVPEPDSETVIVHTHTSGDSMMVSYDSPVKIGAIWMIFTFDGILGDPLYDRVTFGMSLLDNISQSSSPDKPDTLKVLVSTPIAQIKTLPSGEHNLCRIPIESGRISLEYTEVSDSLGEAVYPSAIIKAP